jgi:hypothetical protein
MPALRALGQAAVPALLARLTLPGSAGRAARALADIGQADDAVIRALDRALTPDWLSDQWWIAWALARLGRVDLVLAKASDLPGDVVVSAIAAPYTSVRDCAVPPLPLDYQPLADILDHWPQYVPRLTARFGPGSGTRCTIGPGDVGTALGGLTSPHVAIRGHALHALGDRDLGPEVAPLVLPGLAAVARKDPDADMRRLAIFSLQGWSNDARSYADVLRDARDSDPDPTVRKAATYWFLEAAARAAGTL